MTSEQPELDGEILEYMRQNDGELPQAYLPEVKLPFLLRLRHAVLETLHHSLSHLHTIIKSVLLFLTVIGVLCTGLMICGTIVTDYLNNNYSSDWAVRTLTASSPIPTKQPTQTPYPSGPPPVPCEITNLSSRLAPIYAEPNRNEQVASFTQDQTLQVIGDKDEKWYAVASGGDLIGWFYYQDTYLELDYCND